jgi:hypothetical protein
MWARSLKTGLARGLCLYGMIVPSYLHIAPASTPINEEIALVTRALAVVPDPDPNFWKDFTAWVFKRRNFRLLFPDFPELLQPVSFEEFNNTGNFPESTKQANRKAWNFIQTHTPDPASIKRFSVFKAFVKKEKRHKATFLGVCPTDKPRLIQACSPVASVATGMWMKAFQHYLHSAWRGNQLFAAGVNADQLSDWFSQRVHEYSKFLEDDFTLYDTTFSEYAHEFVLKLYKRAGLERGNWLNGWSYAIRKAQVTAKGYTRTGFKYEIKGTMRSGVADTCLANSICNALVHLYAICKRNRTVSLRNVMEKISMAFMGDDNIILAKQELKVDVPSIEAEIIPSGFMPKLHSVSEPDQLVFLNMRPYPLEPGKYKFAPKIGRLLARLGYSVEEQKVHTVYIHGVAKAFDKSCSHVPILNDLVQVTMDRTKHHDRKYEESSRFLRRNHYNLFSNDKQPETPYLLDFVCKTYNVTLLQIQQAREVIHSIERFPVLVYSQVFNPFIDKDL